MIARLVLAGSLAGCVASSSVVCEDGRVCPQSTVCDVAHQLCVTPDQLAECQGMADGSPCALPVGTGACHDGVCLDAACGNGRLDPGEACDDHNQIDGDGCSASCKSDETCGNGVVDTVAGEVCDDANHLDHDGCSSSCQPETINWTQITEPGPLAGMQAVYDVARDQVVMFGGTRTVFGSPAYVELPGQSMSVWQGGWRSGLAVAPPTQRQRFAMAYDHERQRVIVFGGTVDNTDPYRDTWEWDGAHWLRTADAPTAVIDPAMTYDAKRHRVVMFGGITDSSNPHDTATYEYDGTSWTVVATVGSPTPRNGAVMTYDPVRGVVVMFGGWVAGFVTNEVWEYDGQAWVNRTPATGNPPNLAVPGFAYSTALKKCVLFGGLNGNNGTNAMYEWSGTAWTTFVGTTPPVRGGHAMAEDGRGGLLVFGGEAATTAGAPLSDTWLFDGVKWTQLVTPGARSDFAVATAMDQHKVVMFGGKLITNVTTGASSFLTDTWELGDRGWSLGTTGPPPTEDAAMVYDQMHELFVMFGGIKSPSTLDNTTWLRNSAGTWSSVHPTTSPVGRVAHGMAFDAKRGVTVVYGGLDAGNLPLGDTWTFDGTVWTQLTPAHSPGVRADQLMGYDPVRGVVVLFGGGANSTSYTDTWIWDGTDWHDAMAADHPLPRIFPTGLIWSPARQSLVLAAGVLAFADVFDAWEWRGSPTDPTTGTWHQLTYTTRPPGRAFAGGFTTPDGSAIALYGGSSLVTNNTTLAERWELREDGPGASDACVLAIDADGDQLAGCADPDCWRTCSPDCPPGSSCPATAAQCGNGTCDALENCHTCPGDCPTCTPVCGDFVCDPGETCPGDC